MSHLWQDIRYAFRRLLAARWFTAAAVATLALGIGANAAVFTFVNAVLLRGLPFDDPDRVVALWTENERNQQMGVSYPDLLDYREQTRSFDELASYTTSTVNISENSMVPEQISGAYVTSNFFDVVDIDPVLGRGLLPTDDREGATPAVLLGHSVWQNRYGGDPGVIGRTVRVNSLVATIVGVMPEGMRFPNNNDIWIPFNNLPPESTIRNRSTRFAAIGRLAQTASIESTREELRLIGRGLADQYPESNEELLPNLTTFQERVNGTEIRIVFLSLMGAVAFVLLIACANVANLLLARAAQRTREIAVRVSIGATRGRLIRQLLVESALISTAAGVIGLALAVLGIRWFDANTQDVGKPYWMDFTLDPAVFLFILGVSIGTVLLAGLAPAMQVSATDVNQVLKEGGRAGSGGKQSRRWVGFLAVGQLVLTLVLLSGATFMMRSFVAMYRMDVGIDTSRLLIMQLYLPLTQYPEEGPRLQLFEEFERRLGQTAALASAAIATAPPLAGGGSAPISVEGSDPVEDDLRPSVTTVGVTDEYFDVLGVSLLDGRVFNSADGQEGRRVAIVNQRFADIHLEGPPLGQRFTLGNTGPDGVVLEPLTVIGIAPNIRQRDVEEILPDPVAYVPLRSSAGRVASVMVRPQGDPSAAISAVRSALAPVDPDLPLSGIQTMDDYLAERRWAIRVFGLMFSFFAVVALLLAAVGIYSVTANTVVQRTQEFGIRLSLGALPRDISRLALRRGVIHLAMGMPIGLLGALGVGQLLQGLMVQMSPLDPITFLTIIGLLGGVVLLACWIPARRAGAVDPATALRIEG